jgi:DNA-binding PadR family transcriptional regulator
MRHFHHHHHGRHEARAAHHWGEGERHFGRGFRHHGRGRRMRLFHGGELRLVLLKLIEEQPRHGYDLIKEVESRSGGAYAPSPGLVYPLTTLMLDRGLIEETPGEAGRKLFAITEAGRKDLVDHADHVDIAFAKLAALAEASERADPAPVSRALDNLKAAISNRLSQGAVDKATVLDIAGLIDQAASGIERL